MEPQYRIQQNNDPWLGHNDLDSPAARMVEAGMDSMGAEVANG